MVIIAGCLQAWRLQTRSPKLTITPKSTPEQVLWEMDERRFLLESAENDSVSTLTFRIALLFIVPGTVVAVCTNFRHFLCLFIQVWRRRS
jgi:hypothetical protein